MHWIIKHGVRRSGMSAYGPFYKEEELWQLAAFVKRIPHLPAAKWPAPGSVDTKFRCALGIGGGRWQHRGDTVESSS